jgi:hypothetical protein
VVDFGSSTKGAVVSEPGVGVQRCPRNANTVEVRADRLEVSLGATRAAGEDLLTSDASDSTLRARRETLVASVAA